MPYGSPPYAGGGVEDAMAGKIKMTLPDGRVVDGVEVGVDESTERWSDVKLKDGSSFRLKISIISAARAEGVFDQQGNPIYTFNMAPIVALAEAPQSLKKKGH